MADQFVLSHIRRLPVFERLTPEQLALVASIVQALRYEPGEIIIRQGQRNEGLLLFVSGRALLVQTGQDGREVTIGTVSANEYLNETSLFAESAAPASLRVQETAIVLFLPRQQLAALAAQRPDIQSALQLARAHFSADTSQKVFKSQRENEKILAVFRAHWWSFAGKLWVPFFVAAILFILASLAGAMGSLSVFLFLFGLIVPALLAVYLFVEWANDKVVITDQRITRIRRTIHNWATHISEIPIGAIHEVNVTIPPTDPFARLFDYGNLIVKTSGDTLNLMLDHVPNPKAVQNIIFTNRNQYQENQVRQNRDAMRNELEVFLGRTSARPADAPVVPAPTVTRRTGFLQMRYLNEKGETVYRKHYLVWLWHVTLPLLVLLAGIVLFVASAFQVFGTNGGGLGFAGFALAFLVTLFGAAMLYLADWDWRNDMYILGDQTISIIHRRPLWLQDHHDQLLLSQVDNVISEMRGMLNNLAQKGDVKLLLTGTEVQNAKVFKNVHRPQQIQHEIAERRRSVQTQQTEAESKRQRQAILDYLAIYHDSLKDVAQDVNVAGQNAEPPPPPPPPIQPPPIVDRTRPPGIPRVRRDGS